MNQIMISNIDEQILQGLKQAAWRRGMPLDACIRQLLTEAVEEDLGRWRAVNIRCREKASGVSAEAA